MTKISNKCLEKVKENESAALTCINDYLINSNRPTFTLSASEVKELGGVDKVLSFINEGLSPIQGLSLDEQLSFLRHYTASKKLEGKAKNLEKKLIVDLYNGNPYPFKCLKIGIIKRDLFCQKQWLRIYEPEIDRSKWTKYYHQGLDHQIEALTSKTIIFNIGEKLINYDWWIEEAY